MLTGRPSTGAARPPVHLFVHLSRRTRMDLYGFRGTIRSIWNSARTG
jgi:hypothetical protein